MGEVVRLCDINVENSVYFTLTNPHYQYSQIMDAAYDYPQEEIRILSVFKLAQRLDLKITYKTDNPDAKAWLDELYDTYIRIYD